MRIEGQRILLTGAAGGIGSQLAFALAKKGAKLVLLGRNASNLITLQHQLESCNAKAQIIIGDLSNADFPVQAVNEAYERMGGLDVLISSAGVSDFIDFETQSPASISSLMLINAVAPMLLAHAALPILKAQKKGMIVNIGSMMGSIGFPHYVSYSASKFAVRGFSQALRRELVDTGIQVLYVAPRATRTRMNKAVSVAWMDRQGTAMDSPEFVANKIVAAMESGQQETFIGQPESFFAYVNSVLPGLVDAGLKKQTREARLFCKKAN